MLKLGSSVKAAFVIKNRKESVIDLMDFSFKTDCENKIEAVFCFKNLPILFELTGVLLPPVNKRK